MRMNSPDRIRKFGAQAHDHAQQIQSDITDLGCAVLILVHSAADLQADTHPNTYHGTNDEESDQEFDQELLPLGHVRHAMASPWLWLRQASRLLLAEHTAACRPWLQ